jgi:hypothetical protein
LTTYGIQLIYQDVLTISSDCTVLVLEIVLIVFMTKVTDNDADVLE